MAGIQMTHAFDRNGARWAAVDYVKGTGAEPLTVSAATPLSTMSALSFEAATTRHHVSVLSFVYTRMESMAPTAASASTGKSWSLLAPPTA